MEPIRGPLDYHRYPPRMQHRPGTRTTSDPLTAARPYSSGRAPDNPAPLRPRTLRRPGEREGDEAPPPDSNFVPTPVFLSAVPPAESGDDADLFRSRPAPIKRRRLKRHRTAASADNAADDASDEAPDPSFHRHRLPAHALDELPAPRGRKRRRTLNLRRRSRRPVPPDGDASGGDDGGGDDGGGSPPRRTRAGRRPFWILVRRAALVLAVIACAELGAAALTSPRLAVQQVDIVGAEITSPAALREFTSTLVGQNWIRAHVREATRAVSSLPTVRSAQVVRVMSWPPSLQLQIEERQPFARVGGGGQWWVVDRDGVPFRHVTGADAELYAITAPTLQPQFGQPLPPAVWQPVVDLAAVITDARRTDSGAQDWALRRIYFDKQGFASLRLAGGANDQLLIRLGEGQWPEKLRRARLALDFFARTGRHAVALNLISYSRPTWTPRPDGGAALAGNAQPDGFSTDGSTGAETVSGSAPPASQT